MTGDDMNGEAWLRAVLAAPQAAPDERFVERVRRSVVLEARIARSHRSARRKLVAEIAGTVAVGAAFFGLANLAPGLSFYDLVASSGPALAGLAALTLWVLVGVPQRAPEGL